MKHFGLFATALMACVGVGSAEAYAGTMSASALNNDAAILGQFNLVNFGNYSAANETEGRIVVGGNFNATGGAHNLGFNGGGGNTTTAVNGQQYGVATIYGNVTGGFNPTGDTYILGTSSGTFNNLNGATFDVVGSAAGSTISGAGTINTSQSSFAGTAQNTQASNIHTGVASTTVFPYGSSISTNFQAPMTTLASALANLPNLSGVSAQALPNPAGGNLVFTANADYVHSGLSYGVVTTTYDNLASEQNFGGINNNGNAATFVIVTGNDPNVALPTMNSSSTASNVIWDFVDATVLRFQGIWYGQVLAPNATITQQNGDLDGSVIVQSLQQTNELHFDAKFTGNLSGLAGIPTSAAVATTVPEPSTLAIAASGLLFLHVARRTGRKRVR